MRKKSLLTKVVALGATATLLASTTAFAAMYSTRTIYLKGEPNYVYVTTTVNGLTTGDEVTYLAGDTSDPIYINQYTVETADGTTKSFSYKTTKDRSGVVGATVKMAKTDSTFSNPATITDGDTKLPDTDKFTLTVNVDGTKAKDFTFEAYDVTSKIFALDGVALGSGKTIKSATYGDESVTASVGANDVISVTINGGLTTITANNEMAVTNGTLNIVTENVKEPSIAYTSGVKSKSYEYKVDDNTTITGPMFAIYAAVEGSDVAEYGIAVSFVSEFDGTDSSKYELYQAASNENGNFGVAVFDDNTENAMTKAYARPYYKVGSDIKFGDMKVINFN